MTFARFRTNYHQVIILVLAYNICSKHELSREEEVEFSWLKTTGLQNRNTSAHTGTLGSLLTSCNLRLSYLDRLGGGGGGSNSKFRDMLKDFSAAAVRCAFIITLIFYIFSFFSFFFFSFFLHFLHFLLN